LLSELRAHVASYTAYRVDDSVANLTAIAQRVRISLPPTARKRSQLVQAIPDAFHQGIPESQRGHYYHNSTFVDDTGIADIRDWIYGAINNSTRAAYAIFGHPNDDHRAPCLSKEKMVELASYMMQYLGFLIHTRKMIIAWPVDKWQHLAQLIDDILATASRKITAKQSNSLLGMVQWLLLLQSTCLCIYSISLMMLRVLHGDQCLDALTGFGTSQLVAGSDIGIGTIAFSWMLLQSRIFACFG
jgi:hypothetical protein